MSTPSKILQSVFLVFALVLIAKSLALLRDILIAYKFGQGELTDAYFIAFQIPHTLIYIMGINLLKGMSSSLFSESIAQNKKEELSLQFSTIFNGAFVITLVITIIGIWKMPLLVGLLPFSYQAVSFDMIVFLGRLMFPFLILFGLSDYLGATLNAFRNFFLPGFSLVVANSVIIISLLVLSDSLSILSLAYGTLAGFAIALLIQFIFVVKTKIPYRISAFDFRIAPVRNYLRKSAPLLLVTSLAQLTILIGYIIALNLDEGMVSSLSYAGKINDLSISLFVLPLLTVLLPEFARDKATNNIDALKSHIRFGAEVIAAVIIFCTAFLLVYYREVVVALFQRGEFTAADASLTGGVLKIYLIGLCFQAGYLFFVFIYLGMQKTKSLTIIGLISYSINIILLFLLSKNYGIYGIAWAVVISSVVYFLLLFITFKIYYIRFSLIKQGRKLLKIVFSGLVMVVIFYFSLQWQISESVIIQILFAGTAGSIIYLSMLHFFRIFSFDHVIIGIKRYVREQN